MSDDDNSIEARLVEASKQLVASFSHLDTEAELSAVRGDLPSASGERGVWRRQRWLAVAAAVALLAGGAVAIAASIAIRSGNDNDPVPATATTPESLPAVTTTRTDPDTTDPDTTPTTGGVTTSEPAAVTTDPSVPVAPATTDPPTSVAETTVPAVDPPGDVFVTVSGDDRAIIDVRNSTDVVASFDLTCSADRDCVVRTARVMGDTIWVAIVETEPGQVDSVVGTRVVNVSLTTGDVVEHLSLDGPATVLSAGRGADGVLYAHVDGRERFDRQLIAIERGTAEVLETGVSGFRLSDDGRFLAVSFSDPPAGTPGGIEVTDLVERRTAEFAASVHFNEGPAAWSPDGRYLIMNEQWEDRTAWVVDPWSGSGEPVPGTEGFLDGACFVTDRVVAHRTWDEGYGQGDARPGLIRLTSLDDGSTVAEIGDELFGDGFRCHSDGSVSYLRRPVVVVELSPGFSQLEPDHEAPVELVHIAPDGTTSIIASGDLRMV